MSTLEVQHHGFDGRRGAQDIEELHYWEDENSTGKTTSSAVTVKRSNVTEFGMNNQKNNDNVNDGLGAARAEVAQLRARLRARGLTDQQIEQVMNEAPQQEQQPAVHAPQQPAVHAPQQPAVPYQLSLPNRGSGSVSSLTDEHERNGDYAAAVSVGINGLLQRSIGTFQASSASSVAAQGLNPTSVFGPQESNGAGRIQDVDPIPAYNENQQATGVGASGSADLQPQQRNVDDQDAADGGSGKEEEKEEVSPETGTGTGHEEPDRKPPAKKKPRLS